MTEAAKPGRAARLVVIIVVVAQLGLIARSYVDPHNFFGFQPFNESSEWQADIVRVTADGRRIPIDEPWPGGYEWDELVEWRVLTGPDRRSHAFSGIGATLDYFDEALQWVADHTPDDHETLYLEAEVTYWRNTRGPQFVTYRTDLREEAG